LDKALREADLLTAEDKSFDCTLLSSNKAMGRVAEFFPVGLLNFSY